MCSQGDICTSQNGVSGVTAPAWWGASALVDVLYNVTMLLLYNSLPVLLPARSYNTGKNVRPSLAARFPKCKVNVVIGMYIRKFDLSIQVSCSRIEQNFLYKILQISTVGNTVCTIEVYATGIHGMDCISTQPGDMAWTLVAHNARRCGMDCSGTQCQEMWHAL